MKQKELEKLIKRALRKVDVYPDNSDIPGSSKLREGWTGKIPINYGNKRFYLDITCYRVTDKPKPPSIHPWNVSIK